ncbi:MAG: hypothetical protein KA715_14565 [Xanthomonadaceae bacterium]|nr:hypothetical protein [Xanthomonadaceae bacterium]
MKNMNWLVLIAGLTLSTSYAGEKGGNGGVMFSCPDRVKLVDFWEAEDRGFPMSLGTYKNADLESLVNEYDRRLRFFDPELADEYLTTAQVILSDLRLLEQHPYSQKTQLVRFTYGGSLPESLDSDEITQPRGCEKIQVVTQKQPDTDGEKLLTIDHERWMQLDNEMRALTIYHEINVKRQIERIRINHWIKTNEGHLRVIPPLTSTRNARLFNAWIGSSVLTSTKTLADYGSKAFAWGIQHELRYFNSGISNQMGVPSIYCYLERPIEVFADSRNKIKSASCLIKTPSYMKNRVRLSDVFIKMDFLENCSEKDACITALFNPWNYSRFDPNFFGDRLLSFWEKDLGGKSKRIYLVEIKDTSFHVYSDSRLLIKNAVRMREISMTSLRRTDKKIGYADLEFTADGKATETIHGNREN